MPAIRMRMRLPAWACPGVLPVLVVIWVSSMASRRVARPTAENITQQPEAKLKDV